MISRWANLLICVILFLFISSASAFAKDTNVTIDTNVVVGSFEPEMLGVGMVNWEHSWGKPYPAQVPGLAQAYKAAHIKLIRYAGGLWANSVGFDRQKQRTPYTTWNSGGKEYSFHYGTDEIDSLGAFARDIGAQVMIQVNVSNDDPQMWADMVRYTNVEKNYDFKYWELGNELDYDPSHKMTPSEYNTRFVAYQKAMLAVDPTIKITGAAPAFPVVQNDATNELSGFVTTLPGAAKTGGNDLGALSWHWYQTCNISSIAEVMRYSWDSSTPANSWRNAYTRSWATLLPTRIQQTVLSAHPTVPQGITELNVDACNYDNNLNGNHITAVWFGDILGRLAYSGLDFATMYTGYGVQRYSLLYPNSETAPTRIQARPTYATYLMYANYFGNELLKVTNDNQAVVSVWASRSTGSPQMKLMITNTSAVAETLRLTVTGTTAATATKYELKSSNPTDLSATSSTEAADSKINGIKINAMDLAGSLSAIQPVTVPVSANVITLPLDPYTVTSLQISSSGSITVAPTVSSAPTAQPTAVVTPGGVCPKKKYGDADCAKDPVGNYKVSILDYAIWYSEFVGGCSTTHLTGCGTDADKDGDVMDANFNFPGTEYISTDNQVSIFDYAVWIQGYIVDNT